MSQDEVVALMKSSKTEREWAANADKVLKENGGQYPYWWYRAIMPVYYAREVE